MVMGLRVTSDRAVGGVRRAGRGWRAGAGDWRDDREREVGVGIAKRGADVVRRGTEGSKMKGGLVKNSISRNKIMTSLRIETTVAFLEEGIAEEDTRRRAGT